MSRKLSMLLGGLLGIATFLPATPGVSAPLSLPRPAVDQPANVFQVQCDGRRCWDGNRRGFNRNWDGNRRNWNDRRYHGRRDYSARPYWHRHGYRGRSDWRRWDRWDRGYYRRPYYRSGLYLDFGIPNYGYYEPLPRYYRPRTMYRATGLTRAHINWCYNRYKSYRAFDNTYQPYNGPRRECRGPY